MKATAVNIEVSYQGRNLDMRVPNQVTLSRLVELMTPILLAQGLLLPDKWTLVPISKRVQLDDEVPLYHYPVANGDHFEIVAQGEEDNDRD